MRGNQMNDQKQPSGKVKRVTVSPLTERDVLLLEKIAEKWKTKFGANHI